MLFRSLAIAMSLGAVGLVSVPGPAAAVVPGPNGTMAFMRLVGSNWDIYLLHQDGTETRLTTQPGADVLPSWSPDGSRIAFASSPVDNKNAALDLWTMDPDGTGLTQVTDQPDDDRRGVWSPDGTRLAFTSSRDGNEEIYVTNADGTQPVNLSEHPGRDAQPAWSPDGTRIAFMSTRLGFGPDLWMMNADGTNPRLVARLPGPQRHPAWSPDGGRIAFDGNQAGNYDVYVMDADGEGPATRLTTAPEDEDDPAWSPDGSRLLFTFLQGGQTDLHEMRANGAAQRPLVATPAMEERADWSTAAILGVAAGESGFVPKTAMTRQGTEVAWSFQGEHTATAHGGIFDSGPRSDGETFRYVLAGAGGYRYACGLHGERGRVEVPLLVLPQADGDGTRLEIVWSVGLAAGFVSDIQVQRPGASRFSLWREAETAGSALFVPDAGAGTYRFRARVRPSGSTSGTDYSPVTAITVV